MSDGTTHSTPSGSDRAALLERRLKRERNAREQAEALLREKTQSLYATLRFKKAKVHRKIWNLHYGRRRSLFGIGRQRMTLWNFAHSHYILKVYLPGQAP